MITEYIRRCEYKVGGLKDKFYLIPKELFRLRYKAKGVIVNFDDSKKGDILGVKALKVKLSQDESDNTKFRFKTTIEATLEERFEEPFFYALDQLRKNQYYIIVEDKKGNQYLANAELNTNFSYEYKFTDKRDEANSCVLTFDNLSSIPLLICDEKITSNNVFIGGNCDYSLGTAFKLVMCDSNDLNYTSDNVKINEIYVDNPELMKNIEWQYTTLSLTEKYSDGRFTTELNFSVPLDEYKYYFSYDILEFDKNKYDAIFQTTYHNYIIGDGLFPSYKIRTSDTADNINTVDFSFKKISETPLLYTNSIIMYKFIDEGETRCFGFDKYQILRQYQSPDWGETWKPSDPEVKKKGELLEAESSDCEMFRTVRDGFKCIVDKMYEKWQPIVGDYLCECGNKYEKTIRYVSDDNITYVATDEYGRGKVLENESDDCKYALVRWVETDDTVCYPINESYTEHRVVSSNCVGYDKVNAIKEYVSNNNVDFFPSGVELPSTYEYRSCDCGWGEYHRNQLIGEFRGWDRLRKAYSNLIYYDVLVYKYQSYSLGEGSYTLTMRCEKYGEGYITNLPSDVGFEVKIGDKKINPRLGEPYQIDILSFGKQTPYLRLELLTTDEIKISKYLISFEINKYISGYEIFTEWNVAKKCGEKEEIVPDKVLSEVDGILYPANNLDKTTVLEEKCVTEGDLENIRFPYKFKRYRGNLIPTKQNKFNKFKQYGEDIRYVLSVELDNRGKKNLDGYVDIILSYDVYDTNLPYGVLSVSSVNSTDNLSDYNIGADGWRIENSEYSIQREGKNVRIRYKTPDLECFAIKGSYLLDSVEIMPFKYLPSANGKIKKYKGEYKVPNNFNIYEEYYIYDDFTLDCDCGYYLTRYEFANRYICGYQIQDTSKSYDYVSKYEIWEEWKYCPTTNENIEKTGNIEYRNGVKSCDCGWRAYRDYHNTNQYICGDSIPNWESKGFKSYYKYEKWVSEEYCPEDGKDTGVLIYDYRNGVPCFDCGYIASQWKDDAETICGSNIGDIPIVDVAPELDVDFDDTNKK